MFDDADAMAPSPAQVQEFNAPEAVISASSASMASVDGSHDFDNAIIALSKLEAIEPVGSRSSPARSRSSPGGKSGVSASGDTEPATASSDGDAGKAAVPQAAKSPVQQQKPQQPSPRELVAAKLQEAAAAAAAAAAPLASNLSHIGSFASHAVPMHLVASQLQSAAAAGQSTAVATFATVTAALESSLQRDRGGKAVSRPAARVDPVEWFVADDGETHTRYFVIQVRGVSAWLGNGLLMVVSVVLVSMASLVTAIRHGTRVLRLVAPFTQHGHNMQTLFVPIGLSTRDRTLRYIYGNACQAVATFVSCRTASLHTHYHCALATSAVGALQTLRARHRGRKTSTTGGRT